MTLDRTVDAEADRRWSCNRKKAYPTAELANRVAADVRARGGQNARVVSYACTHCGRYHIGRARDAS